MWRCGGGRFPFGPIRIPVEAFGELESIVRADGRKLRRYYLKALGPGLVFTEDPMDQTFDVGEVTKEPLKAPLGSIFYLDYHYGAEPKGD